MTSFSHLPPPLTTSPSSGTSSPITSSCPYFRYLYHYLFTFCHLISFIFLKVCFLICSSPVAYQSHLLTSSLSPLKLIVLLPSYLLFFLSVFFSYLQLLYHLTTFSHNLFLILLTYIAFFSSSHFPCDLFSSFLQSESFFSFFLYTTQETAQGYIKKEQQFFSSSFKHMICIYPLK